MRRTRLTFALIAVAAALSAAPAQGASGLAVISDCNAHGRLTRQYSLAELKTAYAHLPADVEEYTNCADVISNQIVAQLHAKGGAAAGAKDSGGSFLSTGVIVVLAIVVVAGVGFIAVAARRRTRDGRASQLG
jgi:hypothetical protein